MAASIGVRTALVRSLCRKQTAVANSSTAASTLPSRVLASAHPVRAGFALRLSISSKSVRFLRRELSSLLPLHSAVASACLVSKLPDDSVSFQGRFVNYLSPI